MIRLDDTFLGAYVDATSTPRMEEVLLAQAALEKKDCLGCAYTGWVEWVEQPVLAIEQMKTMADEIRSQADALVVIGIGGSYLGAKAALAFLEGDFPVYFLGQDCSPYTWQQVLRQVQDKVFYVNVISKSGGTLEPALAFRFMRSLLEERYGSDWATYVIATTDAVKGNLNELARREGLRTLVVPDDVGGRFSVLTAVGIFPMLCAGLDTKNLLEGARQERQDIMQGRSDALRYAMLRNQLYGQGKQVEILVVYNPALKELGEWWKQLFGESEGKANQGIYPASAVFTTDLHSLGQYMQEGTDFLMETVLWIEKETEDFLIPSWNKDDDGFNHLAGRSLSWVNEMACQGTMEAHLSGKTPSIKLSIPKRDAHSLGALLYFFEYACGVSALLQGVNPFDQPGVEAYKKNVKALLSKGN